jgi:hypothetical protein
MTDDLRQLAGHMVASIPPSPAVTMFLIASYAYSTGLQANLA